MGEYCSQVGFKESSTRLGSGFGFRHKPHMPPTVCHRHVQCPGLSTPSGMDGALAGMRATVLVLYPPALLPSYPLDRHHVILAAPL